MNNEWGLKLQSTNEFQTDGVLEGKTIEVETENSVLLSVNF